VAKTIPKEPIVKAIPTRSMAVTVTLTRTATVVIIITTTIPRFTTTPAKVMVIMKTAVDNDHIIKNESNDNKQFDTNRLFINQS